MTDKTITITKTEFQKLLNDILDEKFKEQDKKLDEKFKEIDKKFKEQDEKFAIINKNIKQINSNIRNVNCFFEDEIVNEIHGYLIKKYNTNKKTNLIYKKLYLENFENFDDYNYFQFPKKIEKIKINNIKKNEVLIEFDGIGILIPQTLYNTNNNDNYSIFYKYPPDSNNSSNKKYLVIIETKITLKKTNKDEIDGTNVKINEKFEKIKNLRDFLIKCKEFYNLIENKSIIEETLLKIKDIDNLNIEKVLNEYKNNNRTFIDINNDEKILLNHLFSKYSGFQIALKFDMKFDEDNIKLYFGSRSIETAVLNYEIKEKRLHGLAVYSQESENSSYKLNVRFQQVNI